jgi:hypothetical protein
MVQCICHVEIRLLEWTGLETLVTHLHALPRKSMRQAETVEKVGVLQQQKEVLLTFEMAFWQQFTSTTRSD